MEAVLLLVVGILGLALVGFISVMKMMFGKGATPVAVPVIEPLTRGEKLGIVWEILGTRMPDDLRDELTRLHGWRPAVPAPAAPVAPTWATRTPSAEPRPSPVASAAPEALGVWTLDEDRPLSVSSEVSAAAPHAPHWLRALLSFENTIFSLAACLVLGGTLYVVATTWGHVPGRWRHLFLEGVILFYGTALLGASALLDRRLGLKTAARFLAVTAGMTTVGAAIVACAAFGQSLAAGAVGAVLVAVVGAADARAVLRLDRAGGPAPLFYGAALALLATVGAASASGRPVLGGAVLVAAVVVGGPLWLLRVSRPGVPARALAAAFPAAVVLLVVGRWLPATCAAPAFVAAGGTIAAVDVVLAGVSPGLVLVALQAVGLGLAGGNLLASTITVAVGLAVAISRRTSLEDRPDAAGERALAGGLAAAAWCGLAFLWARATQLVTGSGADAWAQTGASALPFAAVAMVLATRERTKDSAAPPLTLTLGTATAIALGSLALALQAFPGLGWPSVATTIGVAILAYGWAGHARGATGSSSWVTAHLLGLVAVWTSTRALAPSFAMAATASAALVLVMTRARPHRLVGTLVLPVALGLGLGDGAPGAWLAALAGAYGVVHLLRPVPVDGTGSLTSRPLGPPAIVGALALALLASNGAHGALVPFDRWPIVVGLGVAPLVGWVAWRGGPTFLAVEAVAGLGAAALGGHPLLGLVLATVLLLGRAPGAMSLAAIALVLFGALAAAAHARPEAVAAPLLVSAGALLARRLGGRDVWLRWLAMPFAIAAVMIAALTASAGHTAWLAPELWAVVAAGALVPFTLAAWRDAPTYVVDEVLAGAGVLVAAALVDAFGQHAGGREAVHAASGGLLALACGLVAAQRRGGRAARAGWIAALSLAPVALVPTCASPLALAPGFAAVASMTTLGFVSRRLRASDLGAWALGAGLPALWWALAAVAKRLSTGAPPEHILPALAIVTALYGITIVLDGHRLAAASPAVTRRLAPVALALAAAFTLAGAALIEDPGPLDAALALAALVFVAALALVIAFRERTGWPFYVAESALGAAYAYLRLRTPWLSGFGDWDGVVAAAGGLICFATERWLRRARAGLGADESRFMATLLPVLSAFFVRPFAPITSAGPLLGAAFLAFLARDRTRPAYGWLAAILANLALPALWLRLGVHSPVAYALPAGVTLALLADIYREQLGAHAGLLRTLAALLSFAATGWEMFRFESFWPAAVLAATAVATVLLGIILRVRAYLTLGFAALVLDIAANLTRWGMHDRLLGGTLGIGAGVVLFALGIVVSRHKELALHRYRRVMAWPW